MSYTLRPYQAEAVDAAEAFMARSLAPHLIVAPTGSGKSLLVAELAKRIHARSGKRVLCLAPSAELVTQNRAKYMLTGERASLFSASAGGRETRSPVVFGSPLTVKNHISRFGTGYALVVVDECFSGGTIISTPHGGKPINSLRNGDIVCNSVGSGKVEAVFTKSVLEIYLVKLANGTTIRCTGSHPFFTGEGWVQASQLEGKSVFRKEDVSNLLNGFRAQVASNEKAGWHASTDNEPDDGGRLERSRNLFSVLRKEMEEPYAQLFIAAEGGGDFETNRAQTASDLGERTWPYRPAEIPPGYTRARVGGGTPNSNRGRSQERNVSERIQGGSCLSAEYDCLGSGREEPRHPCASSRRQKERRAFGSIRVESVSRVKLESPEIVYNLHVGGHPSYFAGGVLVHNCHGLTPTLKSIISAMQEFSPRLRVCGMTATPYRMGTGYIYRELPDGSVHGLDRAVDPYFDKCVYEIGARHLLDQGYLTKPVIGATGDHYDTGGMSLNSRGKFDAADVDRAYHGHGRKTAAIVAEIVAKSAERRGVLLFAATVQHAREVLASLPPTLSAIVTGETPAAERADILRRFLARDLKYLVNVAVLTTGFDAPHVDVIAILRKTESVGLWQQIVGRGLRLSPGKTDCLILDYTTNIDDHIPDGDVFAPVIEAKTTAPGDVRITATCPECGYHNVAAVRADYIVSGEVSVSYDPAGYLLDAMGARVRAGDGVDDGYVSIHFVRRCNGGALLGREYERCNYRWTGKACPHCDEQNDIAARYCIVCRGEIVDPNEKLRSDFKASKRDPAQWQCDEVIDCVTHDTISKSGNPTTRVDITTPYRSFSVWILQDPQHQAGLRDRAKWDALGGEMPTSVRYSKDPVSGFYRVSAWNAPPDVEP